MNAPTPSPDALATALPGGGDLIGLAALGKVAFALLVIVAMIALCAWLLRRFGPGHGDSQSLKIVSGKAVGTKEKVVIVEVEGTWLVLGVSAGGISKLHDLPAPPAKGPPPAPASPQPAGGSFARRFADALKHNTRDSLGGGRR